MPPASPPPDKKLLAVHRTRVKGSDFDKFLAEAIKKNLGFRPELKAYRFASPPDRFASAVILFLDEARKRDLLIYVLAAIAKKIAKLPLPFTRDDVYLLCEIAIAQRVHNELYLIAILPHVDRYLETDAADAALADRFKTLAALLLEHPPGRYDDPKLPARVRATLARMGKGGKAASTKLDLTQYFADFDDWDRAVSKLVAKRYAKVASVGALLDQLQAVAGKKAKAPWLTRTKALLASEPKLVELLRAMLDPKLLPDDPHLFTERLLHAAVYAAGAGGGTLLDSVRKLRAKTSSKLVQKACDDVT